MNQTKAFSFCIIFFLLILTACVPSRSGHSQADVSTSPGAVGVDINSDVKISADYESNVNLDRFSSVYRLTEDRTDNGGYGVVLWCNQSIKDFTVTLMDTDPNSFVFTEKEVLFVLPQVVSGQAVLLVTYIPRPSPKQKCHSSPLRVKEQNV